MKIRNGCLAAMSALAFWSMSSPRADASEVLYNGAGFMVGSQTLTDSFSLSSPGTLTVTLGNVGWPAPLSNLQLLVSSSGGVLGQMNASNATTPLTSTFDVTSGNIAAQWFGTANAQSALDAGVYSLEIQFQPSAGNPVPLPTSIALLLSGIGLLIWQRRARPEAASDVGESTGMQAS